MPKTWPESLRNNPDKESASSGENTELIAAWKIQRLISQVLSFFGSIFVYIQVYIGPPLAVLLVIGNFFSEERTPLAIGIFVVLTIISIVLAIYVMLEFRNTYSGYLDEPIASADLMPIDLGKNAALNKIWTEVATKLGIDRIPIKLWCRPNKFSVNASALSLKKGAHVLISNGLLRSIIQKPDVVKAILFHEGAHIAQKDSRLWPKADALLYVTRRVYRKIVIVLAVIYLIGAIIAPINYRPSVADPHAQDWIDARNEAILKSSGNVFLAVEYAGIFLLAGAAVSWIRRRSEFSADLAARAFCGPAGINSILESAASRETLKRFNYFTTHPSATRRLQATRNNPWKRFVLKLACIGMAFVPVYVIGQFASVGDDLVGSFMPLVAAIFLFFFFAILFY